jgi:hypothetical protein
LHRDQVVWDENQNRARASSAAFTDPEMSVSLGSILADLGHSPEFALRCYPQHSLGWLTAAFVREHEQIIKPDENECDPAHAEVIGKKTGSRQRAFAKQAEIEILRTEFLRPEVQAQVNASNG